MSRVVHVISGLLTGGAEMMLHKLIGATNSGRFEHTVVSLSSGNWPMVAKIEQLGAPVHLGGMRPGLPSPKAAFDVARLIRRLRPDLLHGWMYHGNLAAQISSFLLASRAPVIWNICDARDRHNKRSTDLAGWLGARLSRYPDRIVSDSHASGRIHQENRRYFADRWEVIPNGFDLDRFQPSEDARIEIRRELGLPDDAFLVGLIGRYNPVKGHACFLEAAARLRAQVPDAHFLMAGRDVAGSQPLLDQITSLGLTGCVHSLKERTDVPRIAAALDISVSASLSESLPSVVGESMCCGVPCVVTDVGDSGLLVGDTGAVVPRENPAAIADACAQLASCGRDLRKALGLAARERIVQHYSFEAFVSRYERVYQQALDGKRQGIHAATSESRPAAKVWGRGA